VYFIQPYEYQEAWDKLRFEEMGIIQPTKRDISDFDAGLKYHVSTGRKRFLFFNRASRFLYSIKIILYMG